MAVFEVEATPERGRMRGLFPGAGVLEDELPHPPLRRRLRVPKPSADEAVARLQMQVERRCRHLVAALVEQARALPGLVRSFVVGEACVALGADQRDRLAAGRGGQKGVSTW